jgi:hypothetical protein
MRWEPGRYTRRQVHKDGASPVPTEFSALWLVSAIGCIRFLSKLSEDGKELLRLADEKPIGS